MTPIPGQRYALRRAGDWCGVPQIPRFAVCAPPHRGAKPCEGVCKDPHTHELHMLPVGTLGTVQHVKNRSGGGSTLCFVPDDLEARARGAYRYCLPGDEKRLDALLAPVTQEEAT